MKRYFRYFLGILGSTLLGQPSTLSAEFIPQKPTSPPTSNDSFLGKLTEVSGRSTRDENDKVVPSVLNIVQKNYELIEGKHLTFDDGIVVKRENCELDSPAVSVTATIKSDIFCEISTNSNYFVHEDKSITLYWSKEYYWSTNTDCSDKKIFVRCDDAVFKDRETAELILSNPTEGAIIGQGNAILNIIDNDGSTIGFSQSNYVKGRDFATVTVERKNCIKGHISTASAEIYQQSSSYTGTPCYNTGSLQGTVNWKENECGAKDVYIASSNCPFSDIFATGTTLNPTFNQLNFEQITHLTHKSKLW